jgi:hypothetical protein
VQAHRLSGVIHWFQGDPAQWPIVAGERQAAFSPEGLEHLHTWLLERARLAKAPVPVTVRRPAPRPKALTPLRPRTRHVATNK